MTTRLAAHLLPTHAATMRALSIESFGHPMVAVDTPVAAPGPGDVVVHVCENAT